MPAIDGSNSPMTELLLEGEDAVVFLASELSNRVTGAVIEVGGGRYM
jgi:hypothetical protein